MIDKSKFADSWNGFRKKKSPSVLGDSLLQGVKVFSSTVVCFTVKSRNIAR